MPDNQSGMDQKDFDKFGHLNIKGHKADEIIVDECCGCKTLANVNIERVKEIADKWMNNICLRCDTKMEIRDGMPYCPNCTDKLSFWNPSHNAMVKIAIEVGSMWFGTGCSF